MHLGVVEERTVDQRGREDQLMDAVVSAVGLDDARPEFQLLVAGLKRGLEGEEGGVGFMFVVEDEGWVGGW